MIRNRDLILILDFGSQYTQLIARRIRELGIFSLVEPYNISVSKIRELNPKGIVLSGGPNSVNFSKTLRPRKDIFNLKSTREHILPFDQDICTASFPR